MASTNICKFNKFSHCKYSRFCNFYHENKKCEIKNCDAKKCNLRHPAPCRNILQGKVCPFGNFCSFKHSLENAPSKPLETAAKAMESSVAIKIDALEKVLLAKDEKIRNLQETIENNNNNYSSDEDTETTSPEIQSLVAEALQWSESEDYGYEELECEICGFEAKSNTGLKIHIRKKHCRCDHCDNTFGTKDNLNRHIEAYNILEKIEVKENAEKKLTLRQHLCEEKCFGIFSTDKIRDDKLPNLFLHSSECWGVSGGHTCPDIPEAKKQEPADYDVMNDDSVLADLDYYEPTLHTAMDMMLVDDTPEGNFQLDWNSVDKIINKYTRKY